MSERLQKVLAARGAASRRGAEDLIRSGRVTVNGATAALGQSVDPEHDEIAVDGQVVQEIPAHLYLALHKPVGYVSSLRSTHGERLITELLPEGRHLVPVGRLDRDTSGLLLVTNDGDWLNRVTHPSYQVEREYEAAVRGVPSERTLDVLRHGVPLPDGSMTSPARVEMMERRGAQARLRITVIEGKKRQIRLMLHGVGHPVIELRRVRVGPVRLGNVAPGDWRELTQEEIEALGSAKPQQRGRSLVRANDGDRNRRASGVGEVHRRQGPG